MLSTVIGRLRIVAFMEGTSLLLLFLVTMPLKYLADIHEPNHIVGLLHGVLFISYCLLVLQAAINYKWSLKTTILTGLASVVPFGTFYADHKVFKKVKPE